MFLFELKVCDCERYQKNLAMFMHLNKIPEVRLLQFEVFDYCPYCGKLLSKHTEAYSL